MILDAKLRFLGRQSKFNKIAIFEVPPHKRTIFAQIDYDIENFFVQFPYLIFILPYQNTITGQVMLKPSLIGSSSHVYVYVKNKPLQHKNNKLGKIGAIGAKICFGTDVTSDLDTPEDNLKSLFMKISKLYFATAFLLSDHPPVFDSFHDWHRKTQENYDIAMLDFEKYALPFDTNSTTYITWKFFPANRQLL